MRLLLHIAVLCSIVFVGCTTDKRTATLIRHAEDIAIEHPDSALRVIRSIDPRALRGDHDIAHYQLVYSESLYYNIIDSDNDSLTRPMAEYYLYDDNHAERARAMYQHAIVRVNAKNNAEAMYYLNEAEKSLEHTDNPRLAGIVHRQKGEIYGEECLFNNALEEYELSLNHFEKTGLKYHIINVIHDIGRIYRQLREFDLAELYLQKAADICIRDKYISLLGYILWDLAEVYIETDRIEQCKDVITIYDSYNCISSNELQYYHFCAIIAAEANNRAMAIEYLNKANCYPHNIYFDDTYFKHIVYKKLGEYDTALNYYAQSKMSQDELMLDVLNIPVLNLQMDILNNQLKNEQQEANNIRLNYIIAIISLFSLSMLIIVYLRYRNMRQKKDIAEYITIISELQQSIKSSSDNQPYYDDFIEINNLCEIYFQYVDTPKESSKIASSVIKIIESIKSDESRIHNLENLVNLRDNNIMHQLREINPKLNNKELRYLLYYLLGFSTRSLCVLLNTDAAAISRLKYKIKTKLKESNNEYLSNKVFAGKL